MNLCPIAPSHPIEVAAICYEAKNVASSVQAENIACRLQTSAADRSGGLAGEPKKPPSKKQRLSEAHAPSVSHVAALWLYASAQRFHAPYDGANMVNPAVQSLIC